MSGHTTYLSYFISNPDWQKLTAALILGGGLVALGKSLTARLRSEEGVDSAIVPQGSFSTFAFVDVFFEGFIHFYESILGEHNRKHLSFVATIFVFLLLSNLLGLIPGFPAITTTIWINVGMAATVFVYFNWQGIKANGIWAYLAHFAGPIWWLAILMFPLEIVSITLRILTLNLRLYWNMTADHQVLSAFTELLGAGIPIVFYVLGTFVCFMQAFVFTTLTMVYILLAEQHEEEH